MKMRNLGRIALSLALAAVAGAAYAHPHMSLESRLEFEMRGRECVGIRVEWLFDSMFSASIIGEYDANRDGAFNKSENESVRLRAFSNLEKYGYFIFLRKGSARSSPKRIEAFEASQRNGLLVYRFRVPLEGLGFRDDFSVSVFDGTFYCAVKHAADFARAVGPAGGEPGPAPRFEVVVNKQYPVYYNPKGAANDFRVYEKWEKGLATAYPEEIRVLAGGG